MPKVFGREVSNLTIIAATVLVGGVAYTQLFSDDQAPVSATKKKLPPTKKKSGDDIYTDEDRKAVFTSFTEPIKNSFKPIIARAAFGTGQIGPGGIDAGWADGEANWGYSGYVTINGSVQGLMENSTTGEGIYVKVGDTWKHNVIKKITTENISFEGPTGEHVAVIGASSEPKDKGDVNSPGTAVVPATVNGALQGAIGNPSGGLPGVAANPSAGFPGLATPADANAADASAQPVFPQGGRRRGGRGRGGFGGG